MSQHGLRRAWSSTDRPLPRFVVRPVQEFMHLEAAGGLVLLAATLAALIWANADAAGYSDFWHTEVRVGVGDWAQTEDLEKLVNDGLMAVFFLVIGLEVKRELTVGELSEVRAALLPAFAAIGGMLVPAAIFLAATAGGPGAEGWGIPIATDVAFALGALAALRARVPPVLVALLLGIAVIDDILAIGVIAVFYSDTIDLGWLAAAIGALVMIRVLNAVHVRYIGAYVVLAILAWFFTFESGVHATIAGVAIGLLTPARPFQPPGAVSDEAIRIANETDDHPADLDEDAHHWRELAWLSREAISPVVRVEHALHQWSSFVVLPIFALANAGIVLNADAIADAAGSGVGLGVALGLVAGKPIGILAGAALAVGIGLARLPRGVGWRHIGGLGCLAGIGFTVSLFISGLAFDDPAIEDLARLGVLGGSVVAAILGIALLAATGRDPAETTSGDEVDEALSGP